jgi:hypothetical protein
MRRAPRLRAEIEHVWNDTTGQNDRWPKDLCPYLPRLCRAPGRRLSRLARTGVEPQSAEADRTAAPRRPRARHRQGRACGGAEGRRFGRRCPEAGDGTGCGASLRQQRLLLDQRHASEDGDASDPGGDERQRSLDLQGSKRAAQASFPTSGPNQASTSRSRNCPMWLVLRRGTGSSAPASTSTT